MLFLCVVRPFEKAWHKVLGLEPTRIGDHVDSGPRFLGQTRLGLGFGNVLGLGFKKKRKKELVSKKKRGVLAEGRLRAWSVFGAYGEGGPEVMIGDGPEGDRSNRMAKQARRNRALSKRKQSA
ncbi:unnamed protein product [Microthlaspi erraticum]|uniref:Uncharacterized protein n=1 Tax=Microthlaspi erraticum TaxID=1685480 RepID=A0A6D2IAC4_9BRAS|nr:unnamed protein product [Microthlaspi erraticum]